MAGDGVYTISGTFVTETGGTNGATIDAWKVSRFPGIPAEGQAPPAGGADSAPSSSGTGYGGPGAWEVYVYTNEPYYIRVQYSGTTYWGLSSAVLNTNAVPGGETDSTIYDAGGQVFNVQHPDYGATGNGSTDDSAAIQSAIAAAEASEYGGIVYFPPGAYHLVAEGLTIGSSNVTLQGAGQGSTLLFVNPNATITPITVSGSGATPGDIGTYSANVVVRDLCVQMSFGSGPTGAANNTPGIIFEYIIFPKLINVNIANFGLGLYITGTVDFSCNRVRVTSSYTSATNGYGVYIDGTSQNASTYFSETVCSFGAFTGTTSYAWYAAGTDLSDLYLHFCEGDGSTYGFYYNGTDAANVVDNVDVHLYQFVADGCLNGITFVNLAAGMVNVDGGWFASSGNNGIGITCSNSSGVQIRGLQLYNTSSNCYGALFNDGSSGCTITQCVFKGSWTQAIYFDAASFCSAFGNAISPNASGSGNGIYSLGSSFLTLTANVFHCASGITLGTGIEVDSTSANSVIANNVIDPTTVTTPISVAGGATNIVQSANIT